MKGRIVMNHIKLKEIIYITTVILCSIISMTGKSNCGQRIDWSDENDR